MTIENNEVKIKGIVKATPTFSHEVYGEGFYVFSLAVLRQSGVADEIPVTVSERLVDLEKIIVGEMISVRGTFRSYNRLDSDKNRLILSVFIDEMYFIDDPDDLYEDMIQLDGYICKNPVYRKTPLGREISDFLLAVNRTYGKTDYIPCLAWGRNARYVSGLEVGSRVKICGRIQSREYQKCISDTETETRVAYEVSVSKVEVVDETDC